MSVVHFFINKDDLPSQTLAQKYGVIDDENFRVSSVFELAANSMAYAVTDGIVLVQAQHDPSLPGYSMSSTKVNLIIKPLTKTGSGLPNIKYFIYRGLLASDFFLNYTGSFSAVNLVPNSGNVSDYIKRIHEDFQKAVSASPVPPNTTTPTDPDYRRTGINLSSSPAEIVDDVFYNERVDATSDIGIVFSTIKAGETLGRFGAGLIGFDVIMEDRTSALIRLSDVQKNENIIVAATPTGDPGDLLIGQMSERERILAYLDPAAFYMSYGAKGLKVTNQFGSNIPSIDFNGWSSIYANFTSRFLTKNTVYLDIRNEYGYSINYGKDNQGNGTHSDSGNHFQLGINGSASPKNYYGNNWPLHIIDVNPNISGNNWITLNLRFWRTYNPVPVIYADFAWKSEKGKSVQLIGVDKFWVDDTYDSPQDKYEPSKVVTDLWSKPFSCAIPIANNQRCGFYVKVYNNRRYVPSIVPLSTFKRDHYLDNVFGPILSLDRLKVINTNKPTQWHSGLGKRYVNLRSDTSDTLMNPDLLVECMLDIGISISNTHVLFYGTIDSFQFIYRKPKPITPLVIGWNQKGAGASEKLSVYTARALETQGIMETDTISTYSYDVNLPLSLGSTSTYVSYSIGGGNLSFQDKEYSILFKREEYVDLIYSTAQTLNPAVHEVYIDLDSMLSVIATSSMDKPSLNIRRAFIKLSGYDSGGSYKSINPVSSGQVQVVSYDKFNYDSIISGINSIRPSITTRPNGFLTLDKFIYSVVKVENFYKLYDEFIPNLPGSLIYRDWALNTAVRIRVHSYGSFAEIPPKRWVVDGMSSFSFKSLTAFMKKNAKQVANNMFTYVKEWGQGNLLEQAVPEAPYRYGIVHERNLYDMKQGNNDDQLAYKALTNKADENIIADNPSPYLRIARPKNTAVFDSIDMGQVLYGFESLVNLKDGKRKIGDGYQRYNVLDPFDLTAIVANIAIPIANILCELRGYTGYEQLSIDENLMPTSSDIYIRLDAFYNISAPSADLYANADAVGLYYAYKKLKYSDQRKLSNLISLYYENDSTGLILNSDPPYYTVSNRWLILCKFMNLIHDVSSSTISWGPSSAHPTSEWQTGGNSNLLVFNNASFRKKIEYFTIFWMNRIIYPKSTGSVITLLGYYNIDIINLDNVTIYSNGKTEAVVFNELMEYLINNFLSDLRTKLMEEQAPKNIV